MSALAEPTRTLIDELLEEQQQLTAVERFARRHERGAMPAQARYYRELLPLEKPAAGEQYAFAVDLDACTGCKACVSACHSLNGLDEDEIWRNVGVIHGGSSAAPYQQTITTACHHCVEPACLEGCPVKAYEKDDATGIVRHLDDQCIGCQYCVLKCPYDVPKYSVKKGIVRKCDMCSSRLAVGEAPACVQACPTGAISIRVVSKSAVAGIASAGSRLVPGAFDSSYTAPTTSYRTQREIPANARPGDAAGLRQEHAHWPLIWMLLLTQAAGGMFVSAAVTSSVTKAPLALVAFVFLNLGLAVSVLHLGRPLGAWRAFLGLRTSWMSREIAAFGLFAGVAGLFTAAAVWPWIPGVQALGASTAFLAVAGVFCSAMIYADTRRTFWSAPLVFAKFFGTMLLLGLTGCATTLAWAGQSVTQVTVAAAVIRIVFFGWEMLHLRHGLADPAAPNHRSMLVMWRLRPSLIILRGALFIGALLFDWRALHGVDAMAATLSFLFTAASQTIERYFFFTAVVAPRMPGVVAT